MEFTSVFDRLVLDLSSEERKELLEKIQSSSSVSVEPLKTESEELEEVNFEKEYNSLGFFYKLILFIISLFTGKNKKTLVEEHLLKKLHYKIKIKYPGLVDFTKKCLITGFRNVLYNLYRSIQPLKEPLHVALGVEKGAFFAFLISIELDYIQKSLVEDTDPYTILDSQDFTEIAEIRGEMEKRFKYIIDNITKEDRTRIYHNVLSLHYLYSLCGFNFEEILTYFEQNQLGGKGFLKFDIAKTKLMHLCDLLYSTNYPPPSNALKAVFLFFHHDKIGDTSFNIDDKLKTLLDSAEIAFNAIRKFNKKVPLVDIIKCIIGNYNYIAHTIKGGEGWFVLFKNYWEKKFNDIFNVFYKDKKASILIEQSLSFLNIDYFSELDYYRSTLGSGVYSITYYLSILFIKNFYEKVYQPKINRSLNILFLNGVFYKKENRSSFTDAYNGMINVSESIVKLDKAVSPSGDIGIKIENIKNEIRNLKAGKKQIIPIFKEINNRARNIIEGCITNYTQLINIIDGILYGQVGGKYDTISNLKSIGGRENNELIASWRSAINIFNRALNLLKDIYQLETKGT